MYEENRRFLEEKSFSVHPPFKGILSWSAIFLYVKELVLLSSDTYFLFRSVKGRVWELHKLILNDGRWFPETADVIFFPEKFVF